MRTIRFVLSLALLLSCVAIAEAQSVLTVRVSDVTARPGATVQVSIKVAGAANVGGLHVELSYDASILQAVEVKPGALAEGAMLESNLSSPGQVVIGLIDSGGMSGDGVLAEVVFQVTGQEGDSSPLDLGNLTGYDATSLDALAVDGVDGTLRVKVKVGEPPPPPPPTRRPMTWLYLLLAGLVLGAGAAAAYLFGRRTPTARPAPGAARASLQVRQGAARPSYLPLRKQITMIGRGPANDVTVDDRKASRRHCQIRRAGSYFTLEDLGSVNGTFLNGQRTTQAQLNDGDVIRVGEAELVFQGPMRRPAE